MWFIIGMVVFLLIIMFFVKSGQIESEELREHNFRVNNIDTKYDKCQYGLEDKYKDTVFHVPKD